jgi:hypothetical protein
MRSGKITSGGLSHMGRQDGRETLLKMKEISIDIELQDAIHRTFDNDVEIIKYFDSSVNVKNGYEAANNVILKIHKLHQFIEEVDQAKTIEIRHSVYQGGYMVWVRSKAKELLIVDGMSFYDMIVSFGVFSDMRGHYDLFNEIKKDLDKPFYVNVFHNNLRAINWLEKKNMSRKSIKRVDGSITLTYQN